MSKIWQPFGLACLTAASLLIPTSVLRADTGPTVRVTSAIGQGVVRLDAKASGPFQYTIHHPSPDLYYIDLTGVTASTMDAAQVLGTDIVRSYRLEQFQDGAKTVSRLEILLGDGASPKITRQGQNGLQIVVSKTGISDANSNEGHAAHVVPASLTDAGSVGGDDSSAIRQISVGKSGDSAEVLVLGSGSLSYHQLRLSKPERLVLDFPSARFTGPHKIASSVDPIRDVRAGQYSPQVARIVIDLTNTAPYDVKKVDGGIAVEFQPATATAAPSADPAASTPPPANDAASSDPALVSESAAKTADPEPLANAPATSSEANSAPAQSTSSAASPATSSTEPAQPAQPSAPPATSAQDNSTKPADAPKTTAPIESSTVQDSVKPAASASPEGSPTQQTAPAMTPAVLPVAPVATVPNSDPAPQQADAATPQGAPAGPSTPVTLSQPIQTGGEKYSGAPISVNLKNVDLQDFFRLIHEISGLNVVVDPSVKGTLTLVLDNVPWDQALDIVMKNNDLDKEVDGNVLRIATKETIKKEADQAKDLAKAQIEAADLVTTTRVLSYAKATDLVTTVTKFLSPRGDVLADDRTNTLIISDIPTVLPVIDNLIRELDRRTQQVEIEARVVQAQRNFARDLGNQFAFSGSATNGRNLFGGASAVGTSPISRFVPPLPSPPVIVGTTAPTPGTATAVQMPLVTNLGAQVPTSAISYAFSSANFALDYIISASESKGVGKLLSKPTLITQNNEEATIKQGTKIPIQTVINNTISVQFVDAVLELQVTPQITAAGTIFMNIHVENTQIDPSIPRIQGIPALDTQAEDSKVLVNDGATVMIGGVFVTNQQTNVNEVPFVGSLPIIGRLFQERTVSVNTTE
ncbi:MAG: type IV pilus secretin PilQ, partial [Candidatus Acidiferrales bacterium]